MTRQTTIVLLLLGVVCLVRSQDFGNLGNNSVILASATERMPIAIPQAFERNDVQEDLGLSQHQSERLATLSSSRKTLIQMSKEIGLDGELQTLGKMTQAEVTDATEKLSALADKERTRFIKEVQEVLTEKQSHRLSQILIQIQLLHRNQRSLPQFGMPLPRELSKQQRSQIQRALYDADRKIREVELVKLKYRYYKAALDDVLGEGSADSFIGPPFGFVLPEDKAQKRVNPRRQ